MANHVLVEVQNRVQIIRLNRPEKKNALTQAMYMAMTDALRAGEADPAVRVILLTGTADCFTAGNDLMDFANAKPGEPSVAVQFLQVLFGVQKPVIAAVAGPAVGIGTTMLLHCDLVYAATNTRFQLPFVNLGLCPEAGSSFILPALMGHHRAADLLFFGDPFGSIVARECGIVNEIYPDAELAAASLAKAAKLAEKPPAALKITKSLVKRGQANAIAETMSREGQQFAALLQAAEAREAMMAFMQKRPPDFSTF
jgi:enoyl-CoA hydratase/carnithine racemase